MQDGRFGHSLQDGCLLLLGSSEDYYLRQYLVISRELMTRGAIFLTFKVRLKKWKQYCSELIIYYPLLYFFNEDPRLNSLR